MHFRIEVFSEQQPFATPPFVSQPLPATSLKQAVYYLDVQQSGIFKVITNQDNHWSELTLFNIHSLTQVCITIFLLHYYID